MGGPGSGKTTFALFKSKQLIESGLIQSGQKVLFLSFARSTISRVEEQAGNLVDSKIKKSIEINTYHGFIWNVLKKHGYLLSKKPLKLTDEMQEHFTFQCEL
jgi:DNA helicase-2/ATP-dependent DNA helicase PcrA